MNRRAEVEHVLSAPACRRAIVAGEHGTVIKLVREALGLRQSQLGVSTGYSQATISRLERGRGRITDLTVLHSMAEALGIPPGCLGLADPPGTRSSTSGPAVGEENDVKRSEFLKGLIGVVAAAGLPPALASDEPRRIGTSTVEECRQALGRLYTLDGQHGSGNLYAVSTYMIERLHRLLDRASYSIETGDELRRVTAAVVENTGWVAFDGGRNDLARQWWLEAIHAADLADDVETRSVVLLSMAMAEANFGSGREAVHLVEATRSAVGSPSPRLASLLSAREALGHGRMGDRAAVARAMTASRALLQRGPSAADPGWIGFWNGADLASHEAKAFRLAGHHRGAELAAREAVTLADATVPRNAAFYRCQLSEVLAEHGDLDEAMALARPLVLGVRSESRRVQRMLDGTVTAIGRRGPQRGAEFARWAEVVAS